MTLAFVFPGQGSQSVGMLNELGERFDIVGKTFAEASDALGYDLWQLVQNGPEETLHQTDKTQPAMLAAGVAVWRVWESVNGQTPVMMAGHSLGEYSALVCASALSFADAVKLVEERGRFMQTAVPAGKGAMAAILGLDDNIVIDVCQQVANNQVVQAVNFNSPGQVVIAGEKDAVERAVERAKEQGAKRAILLPVSVPSHCALMKGAADKLRARLDSVTMGVPKIPVIHNTDVAAYTDPAQIRDALVRQLYNPVRWVETVQSMAAQGVTTLVECGPGKVLAGLNKRIDKNLNALAVFDPASLDKALTNQA